MSDTATLSQSGQSTESSVPQDRRSGNSRGLTQAYELRDLAANAALALRDASIDPVTGKLAMDCKTAVAVQKLVGAWDSAREAIRIMRGRGLPKPVEARNATPRKKASRMKVALLPPVPLSLEKDNGPAPAKAQDVPLE